MNTVLRDDFPLPTLSQALPPLAGLSAAIRDQLDVMFMCASVIVLGRPIVPPALPSPENKSFPASGASPAVNFAMFRHNARTFTGRSSFVDTRPHARNNGWASQAEFHAGLTNRQNDKHSKLQQDKVRHRKRSQTAENARRKRMQRRTWMQPA